VLRSGGCLPGSSPTVKVVGVFVRSLLQLLYYVAGDNRSQQAHSHVTMIVKLLSRIVIVTRLVREDADDSGACMILR
jgi:hypothetical protein